MSTISLRTFRTNNQSTPLLSASIYSLDNIDQLLLVVQHPVQLVVVSSTKITHHMFVPKEEHQRHGVVKLVHLLEVRHLVEVAHVKDGEVLDTVGDSWVGQLVAVCVWREEEKEENQGRTITRDRVRRKWMA